MWLCTLFCDISFSGSPLVSRFPGQEHIVGNTKIPSILYYDKRGEMVAAGAEAEAMHALAEEQELIKVELCVVSAHISNPPVN